MVDLRSARFISLPLNLLLPLPPVDGAMMVIYSVLYR